MMASLPNFYQLLQEQECPICKEKFVLTTYPNVEDDNAIIFYKSCYGHPCHANCSLTYYESVNPNNQKTCVVCRANLGNLDGVIMTPMLPPSLDYLQENLSEDPQSVLGGVMQPPSLDCVLGGVMQPPSLDSLQENQSENVLEDVLLPPSLDSMQENQSENPQSVLGDVMPPPSVDSLQENQSENVLEDVLLPPSLDSMQENQSENLQERAPACCGVAFQKYEFFLTLKPCDHKMHSRCFLDAIMGDLTWRKNKPMVPKNAVHCAQCNCDVTGYDNDFQT